MSTEKLETPTGEVLENVLKRAVFAKENVLAWLGYSKKAEVTEENFFCILEIEVLIINAAFSEQFACGWVKVN